MSIFKNKFFSILLLNIVFFTSAAYLLPIRFETNDDVGMLLLASGKYFGTPDSHLMFINSIYGSILTFLYNHIPSIEWYTILFVIIHIIALSSIIYSIFYSNNILIYKFLLTTILLTIELTLIQNFQFTTTSAIISASGIALLSINKKHLQIIGAVSLIIGSLIRFEASLLLFIISIPLLFKDSIINGSIQLKNKQLLVLMSLAIIIFLKLFDTYSYYRNDDYKNFKLCNNERSTIHDNPNSYDIINNLPKDITYNDYHLFLKFFIDTKTFSYKNLIDINTSLSKLPIGLKLKHILPSFRNYSYYFLFIFLIVLSILVSIKKNDVLLLISTFLFFVIILGFISLDGQIKNRVFLSAFLVIIIVLNNVKIETLKPLFLSLIIISSLGIVFYQFSIITHTKNKNDKQDLVLKNQIKSLELYIRTNKKPIIPFYDALKTENSNPFKLSKCNIYSSIIPIGWLAYHPKTQKRFNNFKMLEDSFVILIENKHLNCIDKILFICKMHYKSPLASKLIISFDNYKIIEFYRKD